MLASIKYVVLFIVLSSHVGCKSHNYHAACVWATSMAEGIHSCIHVHLTVPRRFTVHKRNARTLFFWMAFLFFSPSFIDFIG